MSSTLAPYGIDVRISPHLFKAGGPKAVPWAARFLAKAEPKRVARKPVQKRAKTTKVTKTVSRRPSA
jgi:hypothetical protein